MGPNCNESRKTLVHAQSWGKLGGGGGGTVPVMSPSIPRVCCMHCSQLQGREYGSAAVVH